MSEWRLTKTTRRSIVGIMNEFISIAGAYAADRGRWTCSNCHCAWARRRVGPQVCRFRPLPEGVLEQVRAVCDEQVAKYAEDRW